MDITITYLLIIISLIITLSAQLFISTAYAKYTKIINKKQITGSKAARIILDKNGLNNIKINCVSGYLTDHYNPQQKVINLSEINFAEPSIAALAVASHECGHAIQDKEGYSFMKIRAFLVPIVNFSSYAGYFAILLGCLFGSMNLIWLGIMAEIVILLFQIITLPVEIDASNRAIKELQKYDLLDQNEISGAKTMLTAAALTYVASIATTIIQIIRLILLFDKKER